MNIKYTLISIVIFKSTLALNIQEATLQAQENNRELISIKQQINSAELGLKADKNLLLPVFYSKISQSIYSQTPYSQIPFFPTSFKQADKSFTNINIGVNQTIYSGGQISAKVDISKYNTQAIKSLYREKSINIKAEVAKTYLDVFIWSSMEDIYTKQIQALESIYNQAEGFFNAGLITKVDLLQTKVKLSEAKRDLIQAQSNKKVALAKLSQLIGRDISNERLEKPQIVIQDLQNFEELLKIAYTNRGILDYYRYNVKQSEKLESVEKADFLPKVFGQVEYVYTSQNPYLNPKGNILFTIGASIQFQGISPYYKFLKVKSDTAKLKYDLENIKESIKLELKSAYENFITSKENYKVSLDSVEYAKEYFDLVKQQYENQLATSTDLLNAESSLTKAFESREIYYYNMAKAYIEIKRVLGEDLW